MALSLEKGAFLVSLARRTIETTVIDGRFPYRKEFPPLPAGSDEFLKTHRGAFVTLTKLDGELRGCIGVPYPVKPLEDAIIQAATGAARHDPRFPEVTASELGSVKVEVSALTPPEAVECGALELPSHVRVGTDGLIVSGMGASGLLLPQVATEMSLSPHDFLSLTCRKAGLPSDAWRTGAVVVQRFQAEVFAEAAPRGAVVEPRAAEQ